MARVERSGSLKEVVFRAWEALAGLPARIKTAALSALASVSEFFDRMGCCCWRREVQPPPANASTVSEAARKVLPASVVDPDSVRDIRMPFARIPFDQPMGGELLRNRAYHSLVIRPELSSEVERCLQDDVQDPQPVIKSIRTVCEEFRENERRIVVVRYVLDHYIGNNQFGVAKGIVQLIPDEDERVVAALWIDRIETIEQLIKEKNWEAAFDAVQKWPSGHQRDRFLCYLVRDRGCSYLNTGERVKAVKRIVLIESQDLQHICLAYVVGGLVSDDGEMRKIAGAFLLNSPERCMLEDWRKGLNKEEEVEVDESSEDEEESVPGGVHPVVSPFGLPIHPEPEEASPPPSAIQSEDAKKCWAFVQRRLGIGDLFEAINLFNDSDTISIEEKKTLIEPLIDWCIEAEFFYAAAVCAMSLPDEEERTKWVRKIEDCVFDITVWHDPQETLSLFLVWPAEMRDMALYRFFTHKRYVHQDLASKREALGKMWCIQDSNLRNKCIDHITRDTTSEDREWIGQIYKGTDSGRVFEEWKAARQHPAVEPIVV